MQVSMYIYCKVGVISGKLGKSSTIKCLNFVSRKLAMPCGMEWRLENSCSEIQFSYPNNP